MPKNTIQTVNDLKTPSRTSSCTCGADFYPPHNCGIKTIKQLFAQFLIPAIPLVRDLLHF